MMTIYDFADVINKEIQVIRYPNQEGRFSACFSNCEIKEGICLSGEFGDGRSPTEAINNYARLILGKILVFHAMDKELRQEFVVPKMMVEV
jgi:hypothetical protein